ncbi:MAG TPA: ATP-binding protein [Terriglobales bacterium]|nr:ATP-binding protein [Terriglobales bacterium]
MAEPVSMAAATAPDALRLSNELLGHLPSGVVFFDAQGTVLAANPAARAALGFEQPLGLTVRELLRDAELYEPGGARLGAAAALVAEALETRRILQRKNLHYTTPDGHGRRLGVTLFPLRSQDSQSPGAAGLICLLTDLTVIQALEEELHRRQNLSSLGEMAAGIAHEFKNGLATISGYGQMLRASPDADVRAKVGKILEQVSQLNTMASEFLTFARPLSIQAERVDLDALVRQSAEALRVQTDALQPALKVTIEGTFPPVAGDAMLLSSALMNLLRNAAEAIAQTGRPGVVRISGGARSGEQVRLRFTDDGPGVAPEVVDKIFIPFFTTKSSGAGLGLALAHKIITAHHGSLLLADAAPGHTVFEVRLPGAA